MKTTKAPLNQEAGTGSERSKHRQTYGNCRPFVQRFPRLLISVLLAAALLVTSCGSSLSGAALVALSDSNSSIGSGPSGTSGGFDNSNNSSSGSSSSVPGNSSNNSTGGSASSSGNGSSSSGMDPHTSGSDYSAPSYPGHVTPFSEMQYERPDPEGIRALAEEARQLCKGQDSAAIIRSVERFYDAYDWFYTCYYLADIHYNGDLTDSYWEGEYNYCRSLTSEISQMINIVHTAMAGSPCRRKLESTFGSLGSYSGNSIWDDEMVALMTQEDELISSYYAQSAEYSEDSDEAMAQTLVDLIRIRNQIAAHANYDSYEAFANEYYFYRDYDPEDLAAYLEAIRDELVPLYCRMWGLTTGLDDTTEEETLGYVRTAALAMGGRIWEAYQLMESAGLYDIEYSSVKYDSAFEVYLDTYRVPFVFMCPRQDQYDHLTLAHEFGHFCQDYASQCTGCGIDVCEIFSQGAEYLSLFYNNDTGDLTRYKLADSLATYVEQACYARFEQEIYKIPDSQLSVQALYDLYSEIAVQYGYDYVGYTESEFVTIGHFYTNPMYISSYVISNDAAMQIYQMELEQPGAGLACYEKNLDTEEPYFMAFLKQAGLESPFAPGRLAQVRQTIEAVYPELTGGTASNTTPDNSSSGSDNNFSGRRIPDTEDPIPRPEGNMSLV